MILVFGLSCFFCFWRRKAGCKSTKLKIFCIDWRVVFWKPAFEIWMSSCWLHTTNLVYRFSRILIFSWFPFQMTPSHIEVRRCDGSCHHRKQSCLAVRTRKKRVPVSNHANSWIQQPFKRSHLKFGCMRKIPGLSPTLHGIVNSEGRSNFEWNQLLICKGNWSFP